MKVKLIASAVDGDRSHQYLTSYVVDEHLAVDAGCIGLAREPEDQARIRHVLISHVHLDHIATLPILLENVYDTTSQSVTVLGSRAVLDSLHAHIFNDEIWPDLLRLSKLVPPFVRFQTLEPGQTIPLGNLAVTPIPVDHIIPTQGFLISDATSAVVIGSDTGPTEALWKAANESPHLKAVFLEVSFPNSMDELATLAKHLTPAMFAAEVAKLKGQPALIAVHLKPRFRREIVAELEALGLPNLKIGVPGTEYEF